MSLSSYLTCNLVPRREDPYDDGPQPQTATCCTALHRGFSPDGGLAQQQPRYAPLRTPSSAALLVVDDDDLGGAGADAGNIDGNKQMIATTTTPTKKKKNMIQQKVVRKCKSTVEDVDVSNLIEGPSRLRRSGAVRRDWSFENLRRAGANNNNTASPFRL